MSSPDPKSKVAIVTGSSRGIGKAIAQRLARDGMHLVLNCRQQETSRLELETELRNEGTQVVGLQGDIAKPQTALALCDLALATFGRIDVLVNNAGLAVDNLLVLLSQTEIDAMVMTNVLGVVWMTQAVLPTMLKQKQGCIINISSVLASRPGRGNSVYAGTKGFVDSFTRAVATEVARKNVRVNAVAPGVIATDMSAPVRNLAGEAILERIAVRRLGLPEEIAETVSFLASERAAYIHGAVVPIDGAFLGGI